MLRRGRGGRKASREPTEARPGSSDKAGEEDQLRAYARKCSRAW